jgi:hypothetical protein
MLLALVTLVIFLDGVSLFAQVGPQFPIFFFIQVAEMTSTCNHAWIFVEMESHALFA